MITAAEIHKPEDFYKSPHFFRFETIKQMLAFS